MELPSSPVVLNAANCPIVWNPEWTIGIPLIDSQHMRLVELAEDLRQAIATDGPSSALVTKALKGLVGYCGEHFECEQLLQQQIGFPSLSSHCVEHRVFTENTLRWLSEYQQGRLDPRSVLEAVLGWLLNHICTEDLKIAQCCHAKGIDCQKFVSVSDVLPREDATQMRVPVEVGVLLFLLPGVALIFFVTFWQCRGLSLIICGCACGLVVLLSVGLVLYVRRSLRASMRSFRLAHARQLADNMLAGEIARRIAVMDLADMEKVFANETSPLVSVLEEIVGHLRLYLPYIPEAVLQMVRGGGDHSFDLLPNLTSEIRTSGPLSSSEMPAVEPRNAALSPSKANLLKAIEELRLTAVSPTNEDAHSDFGRSSSGPKRALCVTTASSSAGALRNPLQNKPQTSALAQPRNSNGSSSRPMPFRPAALRVESAESVVSVDSEEQERRMHRRSVAATST
eukprot:RCo042963